MSQNLGPLQTNYNVSLNILGHLKTINILIETKGKFMVLRVQKLKHSRVLTVTLSN